MSSTRSQPHCQKQKKSSNIRPTYVRTLHILSMNIVTLTFVTNPTYHQTLTQANQSHMLKFSCTCIQGPRSKLEIGQKCVW